MKIYSKKELSNHDLSLTYDDISLVPCEVSRIGSRKETSTSVEFLGRKMSLPVISSPMDSVTGVAMAEALDDMGCIGIVNRFDASLNQVNNHHPKISAVSISLNHDEKEIE